MADAPVDLAEIEPDVLELYEDLRNQKKGMGVAALVDGVCQGCHEQLSAMELDKIKRARGSGVRVLPPDPGLLTVAATVAARGNPGPAGIGVQTHRRDRERPRGDRGVDR